MSFEIRVDPEHGVGVQIHKSAAVQDHGDGFAWMEPDVVEELAEQLHRHAFYCQMQRGQRARQAQQDSQPAPAALAVVHPLEPPC